MDLTGSYASVSAVGFTLLGLWWVVVDKHPQWFEREDTARMAPHGPASPAAGVTLAAVRAGRTHATEETAAVTTTKETPATMASTAAS